MSANIIEQIIQAINRLAERVRHLEAAEAGLIDHASRHQDGGADEINVAGLSGKLADPQDAGWLRGVQVSSTAPSEGQVLTYLSNAWTPADASTSTSGKTLIAAGRVNSSSDLQLSDTWQDVPGCSVTLNTQSGDIVVVIANFHFQFQYTSSSTILYGTLNVNGTPRGVRAQYCGYYPGTRAMASQVYVESPGDGQTTYKLQVRRTTTGTGDYCYATHTTLTYLHFR